LPEQPPLDSLNLPHLMLEALPMAMRALAAQIRATRHGLHSGHLPVLAALNARPMMQSELAEIMSVSGATMSNTLTALEERGWVERVRAREDRRVLRISLTEAGKAAYDETMAEMEAQLDALLAPLDDEARAALRRGLTLLNDLFANVVDFD